MYQGHPDQPFGHISFSQHGEDLYLLTLFRTLGVAPHEIAYLDLGAHHPETISNTALMYKLGARGVNVEPNKKLFNEFLLKRPEDTNLNYLVSNDENLSLRKFYMIGETSGRNTACEVTKASNEALGFPTRHEEMVETIKLDLIIENYCQGQFPEFLNIDIEGMDFEVLEGSRYLGDFNKPIVICAEVKTLKLPLFLFKIGFTPVAKFHQNAIFLSNDYHEEYAKILDT